MTEVKKLSISEPRDLESEFGIPEFDVKHKENLGLFFDMVVRGSPQLRFSIANHNGKELYASSLSVEAR
jgi:hypothetical protein